MKPQPIPRNDKTLWTVVSTWINRIFRKYGFATVYEASKVKSDLQQVLKQKNQVANQVDKNNYIVFGSI